MTTPAKHQFSFFMRMLRMLFNIGMPKGVKYPMQMEVDYGFSCGRHWVRIGDAVITQTPGDTIWMRDEDVLKLGWMLFDHGQHWGKPEGDPRYIGQYHDEYIQGHIVQLNNQCIAVESEIVKYKQWVDDLQSGMFVNCVYCGHRYGPKETTPVSMADALKAHIEQCPSHPMAQLKRYIEKMDGGMRVLYASDAFCSKCGHNRDTSSVSSVNNEDGTQSCQQCGTSWVERDGT